MSTRMYVSIQTKETYVHVLFEKWSKIIILEDYLIDGPYNHNEILVIYLETWTKGCLVRLEA